MNEPKTASDLMMEHQLKSQVQMHSPTVLPSTDMQKFLLELIAQSNFPGSISEFISKVKQDIMSADIVQK